MSLSKLVLAALAASFMSAPAAHAQGQSRLPSIAEAAFEYNSYCTNDGGPYYSQNDSRPPSQSSAAAFAASNAEVGWGCDCDGECGPDYCAACEECGGSQLVLFGGFDSWRGVGDRPNILSPAVNNTGTSFGFNYGACLGELSEWTGIGFQLGASYGVFDWSGRQAAPGILTTTAAQQQVFLTTGFFKRADEVSAWSYGLVHDWMFNQAWGAFAVNPTLGQWRAQIAYATDACNEFGVWATLRDKGDTNFTSLGFPVVTRPIDQGNLFWHHKWQRGADSWFWVGIPQENRLDQFAGGSLGNFLIGGSLIAPINDNVALYGNLQYMHPSAAPGPIGNGEASWYIAFGLQFYPRGTARTSTVAGNCWVPLLPVANNGNFLVDTRDFGPI